MERRECVRIAARRWMVNKKELEMEMNVSQHPRVYQASLRGGQEIP